MLKTNDPTSSPSTTPSTILTLEQAHKRLRALGLYGLAAQAQGLLAQPWLAQVLAIEESERSRRSLKRRIRDSRVGTFKPMADFDWNWPTECDRALIEELHSLAFPPRPPTS